MWVMLSDAFISIVAKDCGPDELMVRARRPGDIEKLFPEMTGKIEPFTGSDYHYRAALPRSRIALMLCEQIGDISYSNFKDSVKDRPLHDAYMRVWSAMANLQPQAGAVIDADERLSPFEEAHVFATGHMPPESDDHFGGPILPPTVVKTRKRRPAKNTRGQ